MLTFRIPLEPVAKGRPRFKVKGKYVQTYSPPGTTAAETSLRMWIASELPDSFTLYQGPIAVMLTVHLPFPKSMSKKRREYAKPEPRPDLDNYIKLAFDAMNGLVYKDDALIVMLLAEKMYSDEPRWEIQVKEIP